MVMDLTEGAVTGSQHVCADCAEQLGVAPPKPPKFSTEMLEDLLGGLKGPRREPPRTECCPGCGMAPADFRAKGRLGCPRCYETFRHELMTLLQRIHEAQSHTGRLPSTMVPPSMAPSGSPTSNPDGSPADTRAGQTEEQQAAERDLTELRKNLEDAVRGERYEEAARLRDDLRRAERGETNDDDRDESN